MDDKQTAISKAAVAVFARRGFHQTTVSEIAHEAGVAKGTIYLYFKSKSEILVAIFRRYFDEMLNFVDGLITLKLPVAEALQAFVEKYIGLLRQEPELIQLLGRRPLETSSEGDEAMLSFRSYLIERVSGLLERGIEMGELRPFDTRIGACVVLGMQEAIPLYMTALPKTSADSVEHVTRELVDFMWASIRKEPV